MADDHEHHWHLDQNRAAVYTRPVRWPVVCCRCKLVGEAVAGAAECRDNHPGDFRNVGPLVTVFKVSNIHERGPLEHRGLGGF